MTSGQFKRLLKVAVVPLLLVGFIFFATIVSPPIYASIICRSVENCLTTDGLGESFDDFLRDEGGNLFDIRVAEYEDNEYPRAFISGFPLSIPNARILSVSPYAGTSDAPGSPTDQLKMMVGEPVTLVMGNGNRTDDLRLLNPLGCNELDLVHSPGYFQAGLCGVPNGVVSVRFVTDPQSTEALERMKDNIREEISDGKLALILHFLIGVPSFLVAFLLVAGLVWLVRKAAIYVRNG